MMRSRIVLWLCLSTMALATVGDVAAQAQRPGPSDLRGVVIALKAAGGPCGCVPLNADDLSCCPAYSVLIAGDGAVTYEGLGSVKVRGKKVYKISTRQVKELVDEFHRIGFSSFKARYDDGAVSHANAMTISFTAEGATKSVYVFHGQPEALNRLIRKVYEVSKAGQYVGRA